MTKPEEIAARRAKMIEHLEAAQALADETADDVAGYMIERCACWGGRMRRSDRSEMPISYGG